MALNSVWNVDPVFLSVGELAIRYYSLFMMATWFGGYLLLSWQIRRGGGDVEEAGDFLAYGVIGLLVGARLGHVLFYAFDQALADPLWVLQIWTGGLASHGAAVGVALAMLLFTRRRSIPFLEGTDRLVYSAALGAILIRLGNLYNSEIVGRPTDGSWGVSFPRYDRVDVVLRHPTQIYEALLGLMVLVLLLALSRSWKERERPRGTMTGTFLIAYFGGRFLVEFAKEPQPGEPALPLNLGQLLSIPAVIAGILVLWHSGRSGERARWEVVTARKALATRP